MLLVFKFVIQTLLQINKFVYKPWLQLYQMQKVKSQPFLSDSGLAVFRAVTPLHYHQDQFPYPGLRVLQPVCLFRKDCKVEW